MGFDSSIFMTLDAARRAGRAASPDRADEMAQSLSAILVRVNPGVDPITVSDELLMTTRAESECQFRVCLEHDE